MSSVNLLPEELRKKERLELERARKNRKRVSLRMTNPARIDPSAKRRFKIIPSFFNKRKHEGNTARSAVDRYGLRVTAVADAVEQHLPKKSEKIFGITLGRRKDTKEQRSSQQVNAHTLYTDIAGRTSLHRENDARRADALEEIFRKRIPETPADATSLRGRKREKQQKKKVSMFVPRQRKKSGYPVYVFQVLQAHHSWWFRLRALLHAGTGETQPILRQHKESKVKVPASQPPRGRVGADEQLQSRATVLARKSQGAWWRRLFSRHKKTQSLAVVATGRHNLHSERAKAALPIVVPQTAHPHFWRAWFTWDKKVKSESRSLDGKPMQGKKSLVELLVTKDRRDAPKDTQVTPFPKTIPTKRTVLLTSQTKRGAILSKLFPYTVRMISEVKERKQIRLTASPKSIKTPRKKKPFTVNFVKGQFLKLSPRELERRFLILLWSTICTVFFLVLLYGGLQGYHLTILTHRQVLLHDYARYTENLAALEVRKESVLAFQNKLQTIADALDTHIYWTKFFDALEATTLPNVFYEGISATTNGSIILNASTDSLTSVGEQLLAFEEATDFVRNVTINNATVSGTEDPDAQSGGETVQFSIQLEIQPDIFYKYAVTASSLARP